MGRTWEEQREDLCDRIERDFFLEKFSDRNLPITALTSNDKITNDKIFEEKMRKDAQKDLATRGDFVIDFLIMDHFLKNSNSINAKDLNSLREKYGNNYTLHIIAKNPPVNLGNYLIRTDNERCAETGTKCLAMYFEALVAIIYIEHGIDAARAFFETISFFENVEKN